MSSSWVSYRLTKYAYFFALYHPFKASIVATAFMETIQKPHGNQNIMVRDKIPFLLEFFGHNYFLLWVLN